MGESKQHNTKDKLSPISMREVIGYAVGDAGFNFYWIIIGSYLSYFYTDIFGISAAAAGTMFLVTKIVDAVTDPAMGAIADRTHSRWGKFRPYLLFGAIPMAGAAILTMSTPDLGDTGKLIWAYGTYSMMMLCYTILSTPYSSLAGVITANPQERNSIFGWRVFFAYFTGIIFWGFTPGFASYFANGDEAHGWQMTMVVYASIATVLFIITFLSTKERIQPPQGQVTKPIDDIKDLLKNRPWLILFVLAMIIMMTIVFRGSSATYYFKYFVERPDLMGAFIGVQMAAYAVGCLASPFLTKLMDKAKLLMLLMAIVGVLSIAFSFIPKPPNVGVVTVPNAQSQTLKAADLIKNIEASEGGYRWVEHKSGIFWFIKDLVVIGNGSDTLALEALTNGEDGNRVVSVFQLNSKGEIMQDSADLPIEIKIMFLLNILISLALGPKSPIAWSMYADAADFNEWKTGRRATAMTFSAATFSQKLGGALGSAGILWVLASMGYAANQIQDGASLTGIVWLQTIVPAIFAFIAIFALKFYDLNGSKLEQIQKDLNERNKEV
jgi:GPH family glycoside/pentoside/hexuronide:cation symporter